jgi:hypothetical protein
MRDVLMTGGLMGFMHPRTTWQSWFEIAKHPTVFPHWLDSYIYRHWAKQQPRSKDPVMTVTVANRVCTVDRHIFFGPHGTFWVKSGQDAQPVRLKGQLRRVVPSAVRQERKTRTVEHCPPACLGIGRR